MVAPGTSRLTVVNTARFFRFQLNQGRKCVAISLLPIVRPILLQAISATSSTLVAVTRIAEMPTDHGLCFFLKIWASRLLVQRHTGTAIRGTCAKWRLCQRFNTGLINFHRGFCCSKSWLAAGETDINGISTAQPLGISRQAHHNKRAPRGIIFT